MTIKIKIGRAEKKNTVSRSVPVKKSVAGDLMFLTHPHINIILKKEKVLTFAKNSNYTEDAYAAMKRLMNYLAESGLVGFDSIEGGNVYASLEAKLETPSDDRSILQLTTFHIGEFLQKEKDEIYDEYYADEMEEYLLDPPDEDTTELGEVPQEEKKGIIPKNPMITPIVYRI
tara:strand:- start:386 stop:904 length:519 start_codon:yes stop_codon:yes gene_type:complete